MVVRIHTLELVQPQMVTRMPEQAVPGMQEAPGAQAALAAAEIRMPRMR